MSETPTLTVPTAFNDLSQLAEGMSDRVDDERLMLYGPDAVEENSWIRFAVLLMDQSVALEGVGRAVASIDGGAERPEVARYDIVLDNLQLEGMSEVVYERMLAYRGGAFDGPATGEVSAEAVAAAEAAAVAGDDEGAAMAPPSDPAFDDGEESTMVASAEDYAEHVSASGPTDDPAAAEAAPEAAAEVAPEAAGEYPEMEGQGATVVAQALSEDDEPGAPAEAYPAEAYEESAPTEVYAEHEEVGEEAYADADHEAVEAETADFAAPADEGSDEDYAEAAPEEVAAYAVADDSAQDSADYEPAATEAEGFADVHTDDLAAPPAEDWGTNEIDLANVEDVVDIAAPAAAPLPDAPTAPPGFTLDQGNGALTRQSLGATWEPNLALAPEPRAPSGLFAYGGELPVPERAPRPDLDPSDRIQPAPRPVEPGAEVAVVAAADAYASADDGGYAAGEAVEYAEEEAEEAGDAVEFAEDAEDELEEAVEYAEDDAEEVEAAAEFDAPDEPEAFDDAGTEVEEADFDEPIRDADEVETRMDVELPE